MELTSHLTDVAFFLKKKHLYLAVTCKLANKNGQSLMKKSSTLQMSTATGPTNFSNDGRDVIERQVEVKSEKHKNIESLYEIDRTVTKILEGDHKKIALQFPDEFLADAAAVSEQLRIKTDKEIFILADTSYGSCCVDEVAAEHVNADLIVHYGRSCLSP